MDVIFGALGEILRPLMPILVAVVAAGALLGIGGIARRRKGLGPEETSPQRDGTRAEAPRLSQLEVIAGVAFRRKPVLNREERRVFNLIESFIAECAPDYRILAQISLGEVLTVAGEGLSRREAERAFLAVNAKRLDLGIVDRDFALVAAIEYHGSGHFQGNARERDAVKREALRSAAVPLLEIHAATSTEDLALWLTDIIEKHRVASEGPDR